MKNNFHGIDHIGLTVPDLEEATVFLKEAFNAEVLYDTLKKSDPPRTSTFTKKRLHIPNSMEQRAIRMLALPNGPGIELFEYGGQGQRAAITPSDIGWQHLSLYVDDIDEALKQVEAAGGKRNSDPVKLSGPESGAGNKFVYALTPWGSTIELISYTTPQPYLKEAPRRKWSV